MPVITNNQAIEAQLRKAPVASGNPSGEQVLGGGVHCLEDLFLVKTLVSAAGIGMRVRGTEHHLREPEFLFAGSDQVLTVVNTQVNRNKRQAFAADLEHQGAGVYLVVDRLFGVLGRQVDFGSSGEEFSLPDAFLFRSGRSRGRSRIGGSNISGEAAGRND